MNPTKVRLLDPDMDWETVDRRQTRQTQSKANRVRIQWCLYNYRMFYHMKQSKDCLCYNVEGEARVCAGKGVRVIRAWL